MKGLKPAYCLLMTSMLLASGGCGKVKDYFYPPKGPHNIKIHDCGADSEPNVRDSEAIAFMPDDDTYQVTFLPTQTPHNGPVVPVSPNPFVVAPTTTIQHPVHGPSDCSDAGCYYKYNLSRVKGGVPATKPCTDPGIRIIPGP
jgi:hypothetical protein